MRFSGLGAWSIHKGISDLKLTKSGAAGRCPLVRASPSHGDVLGSGLTATPCSSRMLCSLVPCSVQFGQVASVWIDHLAADTLLWHLYICSHRRSSIDICFFQTCFVVWPAVTNLCFCPFAMLNPMMNNPVPREDGFLFVLIWGHWGGSSS